MKCNFLEVALLLGNSVYHWSWGYVIILVTLKTI